jgi:hypothetical protein
MHFLGGLASVFSLGFLYFISAIPAGAALGVPLWLAALAAWLGYSVGAVVIVAAGAPLREMLTRRFRIEARPAKPTLVHRAWDRFGLPALGLLAPVTIGPQIGALLGLALGASPVRLMLALSLGVLPWAAAFTTLVGFGVKLVR